MTKQGNGQLDRDFLHEVRSQTMQALREALPNVTRVAILDAPNQRNVGDSMIWEGEISYLRELGIKIRYVADRHTYDPETVHRRIGPDGAILIHGGGNFGDLWETHQTHREQIARDFPETAIVQLPQTVYFESAERATQANEVFRAHRRFLLMVRDTPSDDRAARQLPDVRRTYCPDMALGWTPSVRRGLAKNRRKPVAALLRKDKEAGGVESKPFLVAGAEVLDWTDPQFDSLTWKVSRKIPRLAHRVRWARGPALAPFMVYGFMSINRSNVRSGVALFANRELVVTDRLHAHVLASLMQVPNLVMDNSYGKVRSIYEDYTHRFGSATFLNSDEQESALAAAKSILGGTE